MAIATTFGFTQKAKADAARVAAQIPTATVWSRDGKKFEQIIDGLFADLKGQTGYARQKATDLIAGLLMQFDDLYGWDTPRMTEAQEDAFYRFLVIERIKVLDR